MPYVSSFAIEQLDRISRPDMMDLGSNKVDDTLFILLKPLVYEDPILRLRITTPVNFVSDGPSVPRAPFAYTLLGGKGKRAGVTHDYLYRNKLLKRMYDDLIFYHALRAHKNITKLGAWAMYKAVDICGEKHRKGSRSMCLNTYAVCPFTNSNGVIECNPKCGNYDTYAMDNIELLPGCELTKEDLFSDELLRVLTITGR